MIARLRNVTDEFLLQENKDRLDEMDGISARRLCRLSDGMIGRRLTREFAAIVFDFDHRGLLPIMLLKSRSAFRDVTPETPGRPAEK